MQDCDAWAALAGEHIGPYRRMVVWREGAAGDDERIQFDAAEQGLSELGYIVEHDRLRYALWQSAASSGVEFRLGAGPQSLVLTADSAEIVLADGERLQTRLLIGADGAASWVRDTLGLAGRQRAYDQQGLVAHVRPTREHEQTAYQRFLPGGPVALLPLPDGRCSVVWSCPTEDAARIRAGSPAEFSRSVTDATESVLGELELTTAIAGFPLASAHARHYASERAVLLGDAAHQVHPLAGQGVNLGLMDAAVLAEELASHAARPGADPGDLRILRRYERRRRGDNLATLAAMDLFNRAFSAAYPGIALAAGRGLGLVQRLAPVKRRLAAYALGELSKSPDSPQD